jgi:putative transcriptional regulator
MGDRGLTIATTAKLAGLNYDTVANLYHGNAKRIDLGTLDALCRALDVEPGDLLEYEPDA